MYLFEWAVCMDNRRAMTPVGVARRELRARRRLLETLHEEVPPGIGRRALNHLMVQIGIRQFIDVGPGFPLCGYPEAPTQQHYVHQITQRLDACRVVYVGYDPVVAVNLQALLPLSETHTAVIRADLREPLTILTNTKLRRLIDINEPICLVLSLLLHFVPDADDPYGIVAAYHNWLPPCSYLILTHLTCDGRDDDTIKVITDANAPLVMRTKTEIGRFSPALACYRPAWSFQVSDGQPGWKPTTVTRVRAVSAGPTPALPGDLDPSGTHGCSRR
jgi:hypothetical protein